MADLLKDKYEDVVESFEILDCRYPYEFKGGHITGAKSWHTSEFVKERIESVKDSMPTPVNPNKRNILIFHCEFSAERGPRNQRLLRENDRCINNGNYPALHFPELYLLKGGYKAFYEKFPEFCVPKRYIQMSDPDFSSEMRACRARSKTWAEENRLSRSKTGHYGKRTACR